MKFGTLRNLAMGFLFLLFAAGCTSYYRISDRANGSTYYTPIMIARIAVQ
ncbi:MAG: hypothetical protein ACREQO_05740 [Candidatus Binatia bacterium]